MADVEGLLNSRALVGFQMDSTHLHAVLTEIIREQRAQAQSIAQVNQRVDVVETAVGELQDFARRTTSILDSLGTADEIRSLGTHIHQLEARVERELVPAVQDLRSNVDETARRSNDAATATQAMAQSQRDLVANVDQMRGDVGTLSENQRAFATELRDASRVVEETHRTRDVVQQRFDDLARQNQERIDRLEQATQRAVRDVDDINTRSDANFKAIEVAMGDVKEEARRTKADIGNLRAELNSLDNDASHRINKMKEDADSKFAMLLQLMQSFEQNSKLFEAHMAEAGRVLANPRAASRAPSEAGGPTPYRANSGRGGSGYNFSPQARYTGTTAGRGDAEL